jgi:twitching motility protein PilT
MSSALTDDEQKIIQYPTWYITPKPGGDEVVLFKSSNTPPVKMPGELSWFLDLAILEIEKAIERSDYDLHGFAIDVGNLRARCQESQGANGVSTFALRIATDVAPIFSSIGLPDYIQDALMNPDMQRKGGLISVFGAQGTGKTSTVYATVIEYLKRFGGSAYTIEDPIEYDVQGWHGEKGGYLTQSDCTKIGYARAVENSLRFARSILFIGEIRDPRAAAEMLRISIGGQLVIATMHAKDHVSMCQRLISLAQEGGEPQAKSLLANSLQLSIRQELNGGKLQASMLEAATHNDVKTAIEKGDYTAFANAEDKQKTARSRTGQAPSVSSLLSQQRPSFGSR